jgi:hypothetical protein
VNNTHPSKKQPASKKDKRKSSTNFRQGYGIFSALRWIQKTSDSWTIESKIWSINEDTTKRFREQRCVKTMGWRRNKSVVVNGQLRHAKMVSI